MLSPFYVFPGLRNRNLSHIPARRENVWIIPTVFGRLTLQMAPPTNTDLQCIAAFDISRFLGRRDDSLAADQPCVLIYDEVLYVNAFSYDYVS